MDEKVYKVTFSHSVWVKAPSEDEAENLGYDEFVETSPTVDEMGVEVEEETNQAWIEELGL
jgi:hypothetical protein